MEPQATRDLDIGEVLADIFRTYGANIGPFLLIALLTTIPSLLSASRMVELQTDGSIGAIGEIYLWSGLSGLFQLLASALIAYGAYRSMRRQPTTAADYLGLLARRWWAILALGLLQTAIVFGGTFLCCVPGVLALVILFVALPATVIETTGPIEAMQRSWDLTDGYRWKILGILVLVWLIGFVATAPILILQLGMGYLLWGQILAALLGGLLLPIYASSTGLVYYHLRSIKEYVDADDIADVFS